MGGTPFSGGVPRRKGSRWALLRKQPRTPFDEWLVQMMMTPSEFNQEKAQVITPRSEIVIVAVPWVTAELEERH
jgi:hypothetical protein